MTLGRISFEEFAQGTVRLQGDGPRESKVRLFDEDRLQDLLAAHPSVLPIEHIEPAFAPAITLGREIGTASGPMDLLYISPRGHLTIVETKLWRNPGARREVIAQIVDYAKELSQWPVEQLITEVGKQVALGTSGTDLYDYVRTMAHELGDVAPDEAEFYDNLSTNLARGRFLLIVAGDGIRDNVEAMAEFFNDVPQLLFTFALVELTVFRLDADSLIVVPHVLSRTREVTRGVVRMEGTPPSVVVGPATPAPTDGGPTRPVGTAARRTLTEQDFLDQLGDKTEPASASAAATLFDALKAAGFELRFGTASVVAKLPDPAGSAKPLTVFTLYTDGTMQFGWMPEQLAAMGRSPVPAQAFYDSVAGMFAARRQKRGYPLGVTVGTVGTRTDDFMEAVRLFADAIRSTNPRDDVE